MWENFKTLNLNPTNNPAPAQPTPPPKKEQGLDAFLEGKDYFYTPKLKSIKEKPTDEELKATFSSLQNFNHRIQVDSFQNEKFFIIRSNNVDDIHKVC